MALLKIRQFPDLKLKQAAIAVTDFNQVQQVIDDMFETHYATPHCAALAATQLELTTPWAITVLDCSAQKNQPLCLVNPRIVEMQGEQWALEGCMSVFPEIIQEKVKRALKIKVMAQDRWGHFFELSAEGFLAKCIQHEVDHLSGKLFLHHLSKLKKTKVINKIKKYQRNS